MAYDRILICIDESAHSMRAAKVGFELAKKLNAAIGLISVADIALTISDIDMGIMPSQTIEIAREQSRNIVNECVNIYDGATGVTKFTPEGIPQQEILRIAEEWKADIIVMGTHGRTGLTHLLMGSVTEYVFKHGKTPVLVVPMK